MSFTNKALDYAPAVLGHWTVVVAECHQGPLIKFTLLFQLVLVHVA